MTLPLIPMLLAGQAAGSAWRLGASGLRELVSKDSVGRLLMILYNDYAQSAGLSKRDFYAWASDALLRPELDLVVAGRRTDGEEDVSRLALIIEARLPTTVDAVEIARRIALDAIAIAPFALKAPEDLARYLVAKVEDLERVLGEVQEANENLVEGQELLRRQADENTQRILEAVSASSHQREVVRYVRSDWGPEGAKIALANLGREDPRVLELLHEAVGEPANSEALQRLVDEWPCWLGGGPVEGLVAVASLGQQLALWRLAADTWEAAARTAENNAMRADLLVRAAVATNVAGDSGRSGRLLDDARGTDAHAPRLKLEEAASVHDPDQQLALLDTIRTADPELRALLEAQRALASLLKADCPAARRHLDRAVAEAPQLHQLALVRVNVVVQEARIAIDADRAIDASHLYAASVDARVLREQLLKIGRFEESGRTLMLLCDAQALLGELDSARELIKSAMYAEISAGENAEVLADVALRFSEYRLALEYLADYPESAGSVRQRACALVHTGSSDAVTESLSTLRDLALGGGPESLMAGANRVLSCVEKPYLDWDDDVARVLIGAGHARLVVGARARQLAKTKRYEDATKLLDQYPDEIWALEGRLFVAAVRGQVEELAAAANALLDAGPDQAMTVMCGTALGMSGDSQRASQVLIGVAHSTGAARAWRCDAYHAALVTVANDHNDWGRVRNLWEEWRDLAPGDERLKGWYARILGHGT